MVVHFSKIGQRSSVRRAGVVTVGLASAFLAASQVAYADDRDIAKELDLLKASLNAQKEQVRLQKAEIDALKSSIGRKSVERPASVVAVVTPPPLGASPRPPGFPASKVLPVVAYNDKRLHLGGITVTPGGFIDMAGIWRSRAQGADIGSNWGAIPLGNNALGRTSEIRGSARQSKLSALIEGDINANTRLAGFLEFDMAGAGTNSANTSNGYLPRLRQGYTTIDWLDTGDHLLAGQTWSLLTLNGKGLTPRYELGTPAIDGQALVGASSFRQPGIRYTKDINQRLWFALAAETPQTTFANACNNVVNNTGAAITPTVVGTANVTCLVTGTGSTVGQTGQAQQFSLNHVPDVIGKAAYEADLGDRNLHLEVGGLYRNFYDRVDFGATGGKNLNSSGWGVQAGFFVPIIPKRLDIQGTTLIGKGIARYTAAGFSDATLKGNGAVKPIGQQNFQGTLTYHATPTIDAYITGGFEQQDATFSRTSTGALIGYGIPTADDTGCNFIGGTCAGNTRQVWQITGGLWNKVYQGDFGYIRAGIEYIYTKRTLFAGLGPNGTIVKPTGDDHIIETSLRFYPF